MIMTDSELTELEAATEAVAAANACAYDPEGFKIRAINAGLRRIAMILEDVNLRGEAQR